MVLSKALVSEISSWCTSGQSPGSSRKGSIPGNGEGMIDDPVERGNTASRIAQGNPGAAAGESARAQTFLLQEAMRPGVPLAFERRNGVGVVINVQVVTGSVIDRIDHALEIKRDVLIFGPQRYREGWQPLV